MADAKQGKSPMEDYYNGSSQSRVVLAKPRLGGFGSSSFASSSNKSCNPFGSVLRPPQLKPTSNPFLKVTENFEAAEKDKEKEKDKDSEGTSEDRLKDTKEETEAPKFIPLGSANVTPRTSNPVVAPAQATASSAGFVFGQNLSERVVINENLNNGEASSVDHSTTNGASELLFTSAAASVKENNQDEASSGEASSSDGGSLAAAAAEYERSHARPPPPTAHYNVTGEEGETNVLQISCRLFAWEAGSWRERGRGVLRLNDPPSGTTGGAARLVARVSGSLRVVLNTKLWPGMVVERAGTKSLRITAADAQQQVKLFLIMGAPGDINQLYRTLTARITVNKRVGNCSQNSTSQKAAERLEAAADEAEYLDKANDDVYGREETRYDDKETTEAPQDTPTTRLEAPPQRKTEPETSVDDTPDKETKSLKRKEPAEDETSPKRQCPEILIE
ncbi:ran-binding protein 3 isoform X1 [Ostrinia nubilalis]|uniref:ran-binding protein 3 isoform X1 n=1 Tax=Ostrinia nubilalis TaxID=29057 RepID=UPI0030822EBA